MNLPMKIGDKIRLIRDKECNFTQAYVAEQLGITTRAYSNIENNRSDPGYSRLLKIAEALKCDIGYIINYKQQNSGLRTDIHNLHSVAHLGNIDINALNKMYEDMKKLHAEVIAATRRNNQKQ